MDETVLIAGGSGLIGQALCTILLKNGYKVKLLGRAKNNPLNIPSFIWNPSEQVMDEDAMSAVDYIINLAGANVGEGRWTEERKKELLNSRILSTQLLVNSILKNNYPIKKFIQASAIGYYGLSKENIEFTESSAPGSDFLALLTKQWEEELTPLTSKIPTVILRIGVVFSNTGGALPTMAQPIRLFAGTALGSGKQIIPWIHIDDLMNVFMKGVADPNFKGIYNAVAPESINNLELVRLIGKSLNRPIWPIPAPAFLLKLILGEQAQIVLNGNRVSAKKLMDAEFKHRYPVAKDAVEQLLRKE